MTTQWDALRKRIGAVAEEVTVNGEPAALLRGAWNPTTKTWGKGLIHLRWSRGGVIYQLLTTEGTLSTEELVRMAESVE